MTRLQSLRNNEFSRAFAAEHETIQRWKHGNSQRHENVTAIVERDSRAAGDNTVDGGKLEDERGVRVERRWLIEVAAAQEVDYDDFFVIDQLLWRVLGDSIGSDGGSKTFVVIHKSDKLKRQSRTNR